MRTFLNDMNPSVKFVLVTLSMMVIAFFFNPWTPFLFWIGILAAQIVFSRIKWKTWSLFMLPFAIGAFGYLWTAIVFAAESSGNVIWSFYSLKITQEQLETALSLAFRVMAFSTLSLLFAFTTDPVKFIQSLMQQMKLSPKIAYSVMVGYQFLPVLRNEFIQIQQAQRLRGVALEKHFWHRLFAVRRLLIPLLAGAVRKAERSAFAMEARGFTGEARKEFYRPVMISHVDVWMSLLFFLLLLGSCLGGIMFY